MIKTFHRMALVAAICCPHFLAVAADTVAVMGVVELSGTGATAGTNFNNGVKLAVKEINASGGYAGKQVAYTAYDTLNRPGFRGGSTL